MSRYSQELKQAILKRMMPPESRSVAELALEPCHTRLVANGKRVAQPGKVGQPTGSGRMNETVTTILKNYVLVVNSRGIMKTLLDAKTWGSLAIIALMGLAGCGGGSSGGGGGGSTATGVFLDSAVEGMGYVSGDSAGLTNAEGEFVYEVGKAVRFMVGDIVIGEALGQRLMTPVTLVNGGDADNPTVLNIARFLQSIDEDDNVSNGILITEQVRNLARGKSINFAQSVDAFSNDGNVQIIVSELSAVTTGGARGLVSSTVAQAHLKNTIWGHYAGEYSGSFRGGDSGTWNVTLLPDGSIIGSGFSNNLRGSFAVNGRVGTDGTLNFATGGTSTGVGFTGTLTDDFKLSGTYSGNGVTGSFSGQRSSAS